MFVLFIVLIIGPIIASKFVNFQLNILQLQQPSNWNNNDTLGTSQTGTALLGAGAAATGSGTAGLKPRMMFDYGY